jgi:dipeptidyl aminopeptidase/acylaminoacyl peptidase
VTVLATFQSDSASVQADDHLQWTIPFVIENKYAVGIYFDSLFCTVENLDPGETHTDRISVLDVSYIMAGNTLSAGDSYPFTYSGPSVVEHGRLTFRVAFHRADQSRNAISTQVEVMPGPVSQAHPSQFLTVNGKRVEYVAFPAVRESVPGVLLVHGRGANARTMMRVATRLASKDYTVLTVSMPGYGLSDGPADVAGPGTLKALGAALDQLKATHGVDPKRVAVWGVALGGAAATLLSQQRPDVHATISQSGFYDLWAVYRGMKDPALRDAIVRGAGSDSSAWKERSAALASGKPKALLILHGEKDTYIPAQQAHGFADAMKAGGVDVVTKFFPNSGHELAPGDVIRAAIEFLDRRLE